MTGPLREKVNLWRDADKGLKTRFSSEKLDPPIQRGDISSVQVEQKIQRGTRLQEARLKYYPSIDVSHSELFAGEYEGTVSEAKNTLMDLGFRNNPTAYVEVSDELGPDEGSFCRNMISETGAGNRLPAVFGQPSLFRRIKRQIHVCVFDADDTVHFLAHEERSAWLQPMRHVFVNDAEGRIGTRDFRDLWYDTFGEELGGKEKVEWPTVH